MKQLIFVVETNSTNQSDNRYISKLIVERYDLSNNDIKISFINMGGKGKYKDKAVVSQIKKLSKENKEGTNKVIYCFDTDRIDCNQSDVIMFDKFEQYCSSNQYYLIWFNYNIEYVLLGKKVDSNQKKRESIKFYNDKNIMIPVNKLAYSNKDIKGTSNIYYLLDKFLIKK